VIRVYVVDLLGLVLALGAAPSVPPPPMEVVRPAKKIVVVHAAPGSSARVRIGPRTEYGSPIRYTVVERRGRWLGVITPAVANGRVGWVRASAVRRARYVRERVEVDLSRRLLRVLMDERVVLETRVAVGAAESPTPIGRFAITDKVPGSSLGSVYGCCVLILSGHQPRPPRGWAPVDYRLAIHGGDGRTIGKPISAGCMHVRAATLRLLMKRLPAGTPVTIHP
jgi:lipoprotein-anchoring transpeptidase ErfK/SrfK